MLKIFFIARVVLSSVNLSDAFQALHAKRCRGPLCPPNEVQSSRHAPLHFWQLCQGILLFRMQPPTNQPWTSTWITHQHPQNVDVQNHELACRELLGAANWRQGTWELMRRQCKTAEVHLTLQPIAQMRDYLKGALRAHIAEDEIGPLVKTWPLVIINSATPQEAIEYLKKRIQAELSYHLVNFAREVFAAASRYAMHHPPSWCPTGPERTGRGAPFHYFEVLEQQVTWAAYSFLQPRVGFASAIWLHDGFWVAPRPENASLTALHTHLCQTFGFDLAEPPLMRCDPCSPNLLSCYLNVLLRPLSPVHIPMPPLNGLSLL